MPARMAHGKDRNATWMARPLWPSGGSHVPPRPVEDPGFLEGRADLPTCRKESICFPQWAAMHIYLCLPLRGSGHRERLTWQWPPPRRLHVGSGQRRAAAPGRRRSQLRRRLAKAPKSMLLVCQRPDGQGGDHPRMENGCLSLRGDFCPRQPPPAPSTGPIPSLRAAPHFPLMGEGGKTAAFIS